MTTLFDYPTVASLVAHVGEATRGVMDEGIRHDGPAEDKASRESFHPSSRCRVALVGISCRFPNGIEGAAGLDEVCEQGTVVVSRVPFQRWDVDAAVEWDESLTAIVKRRMMFGGFMERVEWFDASSFGISPSEAEG